MKIGVSGATGFVGSHVVRHFSKQGHKVIGYGRTINSPEALLKYADYVSWDINTKASNLLDCNVFIHCAGFVEFWGSYEEMYKVNIEGLKNVLEAAKNVEHLIYISTASVYSSSDGIHNASENDSHPTNFSNNYSRTKSEAEKLLREYADKIKRITILRPHTIYGPGDRTLVPRILKSIRNGKAIVIGAGKNKFSITHVGNICYGLSLVINSNKDGFEIYNLTDVEKLSINEIYKYLFSALNLKVQTIHISYSLISPVAALLEGIYRLSRSKKPPLITPHIAKQFANESTLSLDKIISELKYRPPYTYEDGFKDLKIWIDTIGGLKNYITNRDCWKGDLITY